MADLLITNSQNELYDRIHSTFPHRQASAEQQHAPVAGTPEGGLITDHPASVKVIFKEDESEPPFVVIFQVPREQVEGSDLLFSLKALEDQRPGDSQSRVPLHEYRVMNVAGEMINPDKPLFRQITGDNAVYLWLFGPVVSNAEN